MPRLASSLLCLSRRSVLTRPFGRLLAVSQDDHGQVSSSWLQVLAFHLYICSEAVPPWTLALLCLSKRMHSLYVLRLFNDCVAMLLAYAATALLIAGWWAAALVAYSAAVSVKMNVLLLAPSVLVVLLKVGTRLINACAAGCRTCWHIASAADCGLSECGAAMSVMRNVLLLAPFDAVGAAQSGCMSPVVWLQLMCLFTPCGGGGL